MPRYNRHHQFIVVALLIIGAGTLILSWLPEILAMVVLGLSQYIFVMIFLRGIGYRRDKSGKPRLGPVWMKEMYAKLIESSAFIIVLTIMGAISWIIVNPVVDFFNSLDVSQRCIIGIALIPTTIYLRIKGIL